MRIIYHLGAHCTDEERLVRCLLRNRGALAAESIVVPGPARYRNLLRDTAIALKGKPATLDTQALVLEQIMEEDEAERLILSWENFLSYAPWALKGQLYPAASERVRAFSQIFPEIEAEYFLAIRNPATFLPALYEKQKSDPVRGKTYAGFMEGVDMFDLRWSDVIESVLDENPGVPLTIWCDEDTPLIWPEVLRAVSGHAETTDLESTDELLVQIMSPEGMTRMRAYLADHPAPNPALRRKVVSAFLEKFGLPDKIDMEFELPGWTEETVVALTRNYEEDVARIMAMPGVTFIGA